MTKPRNSFPVMKPISCKNPFQSQILEAKRYDDVRRFIVRSLQNPKEIEWWLGPHKTRLIIWLVRAYSATDAMIY